MARRLPSWLSCGLLVCLWGLLQGPPAVAGTELLPAEAVDPEEADALFEGRRLALVVGPESFQDTGFAPLRFTDDDARALARVLADPHRGRFDTVISLTGPEETRARDVRAAMRRIGEQARSPDDTVFVYFSTHGTLAPDPRGWFSQYLVLADTRLHDVHGTGIPHDELLDWLESLPSRRKVLLLATCHSGQGKSVLSPEAEEVLRGTKGLPVPPLREVSEAVVFIGVCAWNETARESDDLGHDIYTWFFLQALEDGDLDKDGAVTVTEAHDLARKRTYAFTEGRQRAWARAEILGTDPVVLAGERVRRGRPSLASYHRSLDGYRVRVDGRDKGELPGRVVLEPGTHRVEVLPPGRSRPLVRRRIRFLEGGRLDVDRLLRRDRLRIGYGGGWFQVREGLEPAPAGVAEIHLPRVPGRGWELVSFGGAAVRWPRPTLDGALTVERVLLPGTIQLRAGGGLYGYLLGTSQEPGILAPGLVPVPVVALAWMPMQPLFARLHLTGGYLWYADRGAWHHEAFFRPSLVVGGSL